MSKKVKCPYCGKLTEYSTENKFRPFCSERCQLIDLGEWASNKYAIPVEDSQKPEDDKEDDETPSAKVTDEDA